MLGLFFKAFAIYLVLKVVTVILASRYNWGAPAWFILDSLIAAAVIAWGLGQR
jgi:hypothetical protein